VSERIKITANRVAKCEVVIGDNLEVYARVTAFFDTPLMKPIQQRVLERCIREQEIIDFVAIEGDDRVTITMPAGLGQDGFNALNHACKAAEDKLDRIDAEMRQAQQWVTDVVQPRML
jgi:hypothetical protein